MLYAWSSALLVVQVYLNRSPKVHFDTQPGNCNILESVVLGTEDSNIAVIFSYIFQKQFFQIIAKNWSTKTVKKNRYKKFNTANPCVHCIQIEVAPESNCRVIVTVKAVFAGMTLVVQKTAPNHPQKCKPLNMVFSSLVKSFDVEEPKNQFST